MNIKNKKNCREPSTKFFSLEESCKEIFFLARFLQDVLQKNALSCKTLKENLARSLQRTHFFQPGLIEQYLSEDLAITFFSRYHELVVERNYDFS